MTPPILPAHAVPLLPKPLHYYHIKRQDIRSIHHTCSSLYIRTYPAGMQLKALFALQVRVNSQTNDRPQSTARLMHNENRTSQSQTGKHPDQASTDSQQATETKTGGSFDYVANKRLRRWTEQLAIHRTHCSDTQH